MLGVTAGGGGGGTCPCAPPGWIRPWKLFSSFPDEQSQQKVRHLDRITCVVINTSNEVMCPLLWEFRIYNLFSENLRKGLCLKHCKYKEWVSFYLDSWGMNRSAEQTNRTRTASRFTRFVCPVLRFIPNEPRKKDTHSLIVQWNRLPDSVVSLPRLDPFKVAVSGIHHLKP